MVTMVVLAFGVATIDRRLEHRFCHRDDLGDPLLANVLAQNDFLAGDF